MNSPPIVPSLVDWKCSQKWEDVIAQDPFLSHYLACFISKRHTLDLSLPVYVAPLPHLHLRIPFHVIEVQLIFHTNRIAAQNTAIINIVDECILTKIVESKVGRVSGYRQFAREGHLEL